MGCEATLYWVWKDCQKDFLNESACCGWETIFGGERGSPILGLE